MKKLFALIMAVIVVLGILSIFPVAADTPRSVTGSGGGLPAVTPAETGVTISGLSSSLQTGLAISPDIYVKKDGYDVPYAIVTAEFIKDGKVKAKLGFDYESRGRYKIPSYKSNYGGIQSSSGSWTVPWHLESGTYTVKVKATRIDGIDFETTQTVEVVQNDVSLADVLNSYLPNALAHSAAIANKDAKLQLAKDAYELVLGNRKLFVQQYETKYGNYLNIAKNWLDFALNEYNGKEIHEPEQQRLLEGIKTDLDTLSLGGAFSWGYFKVKISDMLGHKGILLSVISPEDGSTIKSREKFQVKLYLKDSSGMPIDNGVVSVAIPNPGRSDPYNYVEIKLTHTKDGLYELPSTDSSGYRLAQDRIIVLEENKVQPYVLQFEAKVSELTVIKRTILNVQGEEPTVITPTPIAPPPELPVVFAKLDERFTLQNGQTAILTDYRSMHVELRNLESKFCAAVVGQECPGPEATVEVSVSEPVFRTQSGSAELPATAVQQQTTVTQSSSGSASASGGVVAIATASRATATAGGGGGVGVGPVMPITGKILKLNEGESATAFDVTITALDVSSGKATFVVSKKVYVSDVVDVGITPRVVNVGQGSVATYTVTVQDKHPGIACKPGQICPQALPGYIYSIEVIGLPFETSYVKNFAVEAGGKKDFVLTVDTSRTPPFEGPAPDEEVDTAVAQAKATATTEAILPVTGRASAPSADIVRKCLNTGDNYEICITKEGKGTSTATAAGKGVAVSKLGGIHEKPVPRLTTTYPTTYRFAVRVSREGGPVNEGAVDVAYATLNIQPKEPTEPTPAPRRLPPCGKYGDVDQDGYVSVKDANLVSNYTVGNIQLTDIQKKNAEVTADGVVDVGDALFIAQYVNGLRSTFPVCGSSEIIVVPPPIEVQPVEKISISLERGWNLVSLPGKVVTFLPSDCTKNRKLLGFIYLSEQGKYVSLQEARRQLGSEFSEYLSQHAFWVYSYNGCTFEANVKTYVSYDELSLQPGWNLIPITPAMVGKNLNELNVNCDFSKLYKWSAEQQKWNILTQDYAFTEADLNKGFIAKTDNYCELGGELTISPPDWPE